MLSCTHVFHRACLASFERFLRGAKERTCPLCRKANYQKMITSTGARAYRERSVKKIQAHTRGYLMRKFYRKLLRDFFKQGGGDTARRRAYFVGELGAYADRVARQLRRNEDALDALFVELDRNLAISRQVMAGGDAQDAQKQLHGLLVHEWQAVYEKAMQRNEEECPICMVDFDTKKADSKDQVLTSCSHVFHFQCMKAFEDFNIYEISLCPVCRNAYKRIALSESKKNISVKNAKTELPPG